MIYLLRKIGKQTKDSEEIMNIKRDFYLNQLRLREDNGMIKVITGVRRSGKSYLLFNIYCEYLKQKDV